MRRVVACAAALTALAACGGSASTDRNAAVADDTTPPPTAVVAPSSTNPEAGSVPRAPTTSAPVEPSVELGPWDWGPPCRVPVTESFSSNGPQVTRSYVVDVTEVADGIMVRFDAVETRAGGLDDSELADLLVNQAAFLPPMLLRPDGTFVRFVGLSDTITARLAELGQLSDAAAVDAYAAAPDVEEEIRRATVDSWYGYWIDSGTVPFGPTEPETHQLHLGWTPYDTEVTTEGLGPTTPETVTELTLYGPTPVGSVRLFRDERVDESVLLETFDQLVELDPDVDRIREFANAFTLMDPSTLRPYVATTMRSRTFSAGDYLLETEQAQRRVTFAWEDSVGCATPRVAA